MGGGAVIQLFKTNLARDFPREVTFVRTPTKPSAKKKKKLKLFANIIILPNCYPNNQYYY